MAQCQPRRHLHTFPVVLLLASFLTQLSLSSGGSCFDCQDHSIGFRRCGHQARKVVDFAGVCADDRCATPISCSHQLQLNGSECSLYKESDCRREETPKESTLHCGGPQRRCQCRDVPVRLPGSGDLLEDAVVVSAYPYRCDCAVTIGYTTALDIRVRNTGWSALGIVYKVSEQHICREFRLSPAAAKAGDARHHQMQYDCPIFETRHQDVAIELQLCTQHQMVVYRLRLPTLASIVGNSWQPLVMHHVHRTDHLVFSVQRAPPSLCVRQYQLQLVLCDRRDCKDQRPIAGTERTVQLDVCGSLYVWSDRQEECSDSEYNASNFRVKYELPSISGNISLRVLPQDGNYTFSEFVIYEARSSVALVTVVTLMVVLLVLIAAGVVWMKFIYKPPLPECLEVLVLYNCNANLARRVSACLEKYCRIKTKLDVVDIPNTSDDMDPAAWLMGQLECRRYVLLLVFPERTAPPIYQNLYGLAVHHLQMDSGKKTVIVGYCGDATPPPLPTAHRYRLPRHLGGLVRAVRGAAHLGGGLWEAAEMARRLRRSAEGCQLVRLLQAPHQCPPAESPLPPPAVRYSPQPLPPLPGPPPLHTDGLASHVLDLDVLLGDAQLPLQLRPASSDEEDPEIQWR